MEIKVRNVCPVAVSKVDRLAKEKGLSRQAFLKEQIETMQRCSDAMTNMDRTFNKLFGEDDK
ncbi:hypothetical protein C1N61_31145 (plasmid) [Priestia aryabhattai]